jgi:hypothetical protein
MPQGKTWAYIQTSRSSYSTALSCRMKTPSHTMVYRMGPLFTCASSSLAVHDESATLQYNLHWYQRSSLRDTQRTLTEITYRGGPRIAPWRGEGGMEGGGGSTPAYQTDGPCHRTGQVRCATFAPPS